MLQCCLRVKQVDFKGVTVQLLKLTGAFRVAKREAASHITRLMAAQSPLSPQVRACSCSSAQEAAPFQHLDSQRLPPVAAHCCQHSTKVWRQPCRSGLQRSTEQLQ